MPRLWNVSLMECIILSSTLIVGGLILSWLFNAPLNAILLGVIFAELAGDTIDKVYAKLEPIRQMRKLQDGFN